MASLPKTRLSTHYFRYASGNVIVLLAGLLSFPISTRYLSNEAFGVIGFWETWAAFLAALLKLGSGDAMMRHYPHGGDREQFVRFETNFIYLPLLVSCAGWALTMVLVGTGALSGLWDHPYASLLAVGNVLLTVVASNILWVAGTKEMSGFNSSVSVTWRLMSVVASTLVLVYVSQTAEAVLATRVVVGSVLVVFLARWLVRTAVFSRAAIDIPYAMEGVRYGFPLALKEISNITLSLIDRIMLKWMIGDYAVVGIYSIGYALASYLDQVVMAAIGQALTPVMNRLYISEGAAAVKRIKQQVLNMLVYVCGAIIAGLCLSGKELFLLLVGDSKAASFDTFFIMGMYFAVQPILSVMGTGLLLEKKSKTLFALTGMAAVVNIVLNLILIPPFGINGAVMATCFAQLMLHATVYHKCSPELRGWPDAVKVLKVAVLCAICVGSLQALGHFDVVSKWARAGVGAAWVAAVYVVPAVLLDADLKATLWGLVRSRLKR